MAESTDGNKVIEIDHLYKIFGHRASEATQMVEQNASKEEILEKTGCTVAVADACFDVHQNETFVIMGLSGSGKSTMLRLVNRLIEPSFGDVRIDGESIMDAGKKELINLRRNKFSMVFQHFGLLPHRTVIRNVEFGLEVQGMDEDQRRQKAQQAIELVGLSGYEKSLTQELSGGMQQRVGLARALATDPEILLMDEAFSALDPLIRSQMQDELLEIQARMHKTVLFITHDLDEALKLGDRIAIMKDGYIVQIGTPEQILTSPANDYVRNFVEDVDRSKVITARTVMQRPEVLVSSKDGPHQAVRHMEETGFSTSFVVDHDRRLVGLVRIEDAIQEAQQQSTDLSSIMVPAEQLNTMSPDTPLKEMLEPASDTKLPIAVVGEHMEFQGIVTRARILGGIAGYVEEKEGV